MRLALFPQRARRPGVRDRHGIFALIPVLLGALACGERQGAPQKTAATPRVTIEAPANILVDSLPVRITASSPELELHYTLDGSEPTIESPLFEGLLELSSSSVVRARGFLGANPVTPIAGREFRKVSPRPAVSFLRAPDAGLRARVWLGQRSITAALEDPEPDYSEIVTAPRIPPQAEAESGGVVVLDGFLQIEESGVQRFWVSTQGDIRLWIGEEAVIDRTASDTAPGHGGTAALARGWQPVRLAWTWQRGAAPLRFECGGLEAEFSVPQESRWAH